MTKEKQKTRADLVGMISDAEVAHTSLTVRYHALQNRVTAAENEAKETRANFEDLKRRLHDAEVENARLRGYADRVHEDDIVRDGFVEIEDERGKRQVPKRPAQNRLVETGADIMRDMGRHYGGEKKTHWTSY